MTTVIDTVGIYGLIVLLAVLVHEPWRWLGLWLGRTVTVDGEIFQWVRAVATALVAGLVLRLVLFPAGALANVALEVRLAALAGGIGLFFLARRNLAFGVAGGAAVLLLGIAMRN